MNAHTTTPTFAFQVHAPLNADTLARTLEASNIENAEAIARAYFAHDGLVAALREIAESTRRDDANALDAAARFQTVARAALAKAAP